MADNRRQSEYKKRQSILYQNTRFMQHGSEYTLFNSMFALSKCIEEFNQLYQDQLHPKHGLLILLIKHYCTETNNDENLGKRFKPEEIFNYYPNLGELFGYFANSHRSFMVLFSDLRELHFINPLHSSTYYQPTTRIAVFSQIYEKHCKSLFTSKDDEKFSS